MGSAQESLEFITFSPELVELIRMSENIKTRSWFHVVVGREVAHVDESRTHGFGEQYLVAVLEHLCSLGDSEGHGECNVM